MPHKGGLKVRDVDKREHQLHSWEKMKNATYF